MSLRQKFGALALIYVVSLSANLVTSAWCIVVYFRSAFLQYYAAVRQQEEFEHLRSTLRDEVRALRDTGDTDEVTSRYADLNERFVQAMSHAERLTRGETGDHRWRDIRSAAERARQAAASRITSLEQGAPTPLAIAPFEELDRLLTEAGLRSGRARHEKVDAAAVTQQRVMTILVFNAVVGALLCASGLYFVRRWVLRPVADLRKATYEISKGNYAHRIQARSPDELGLLASEVNQMSSTIVEMQRQLVEQERLAAAGEMLGRIVHNIRNPLAGIRGLAEGTACMLPPDSRTYEHQRRIMNTVDRFEKWLRDLQHSVSPLDLAARPVPPSEFIRGVLEALTPMAERRGVSLEAHVDADVPEIRVDPLHFEQAVVSLVTNAVQASERGQSVRVMLSRDNGERGRWRLVVKDRGAGIADDVQRRIFEPYFTTKPDGNGLGLAMASKVVKLHGGTLAVRSTPGQGSEFVATMPGHIAEDGHNG